MIARYQGGCPVTGQRGLGRRYQEQLPRPPSVVSAFRAQSDESREHHGSDHEWPHERRPDCALRLQLRLIAATDVRKPCWTGAGPDQRRHRRGRGRLHPDDGMVWGDRARRQCSHYGQRDPERRWRRMEPFRGQPDGDHQPQRLREHDSCPVPARRRDGRAVHARAGPGLVRQQHRGQRGRGLVTLPLDAIPFDQRSGQPAGRLREQQRLAIERACRLRQQHRRQRRWT